MADKLSKREETKLRKELSDLIARINSPNPSEADMDKFRAYLDSGALDKQVLEANESANQFVATYIDVFAKSSPAMRELLKREIKRKRKTMGYYDAPPILKVLIHRVIVNELRLDHLETSYIRFCNDLSAVNKLKWERMISTLQTRLLKSINAVALVRKTVAEAEYYEQKAESKKRVGTLASLKVYERLSKSS